MDEDRTQNAHAWARHGTMPFTVTTPRGMTALLRDHDHVVMDTRGGMEDTDMLELHDLSDLIVVPAVAEYLTLDALVQTVELFERKNRGLDKVRVLFTMARRGRKLDEARAAVEDLGLRTLRASIRSTEAFRDATTSGVLVRDVRGSSAGKLAWLDYETAFKEMLA